MALSPPTLNPETVAAKSGIPEIWVGSPVKWMRPGKDHDYCLGFVQRVNADGTLALSLIPPPYGGSHQAVIDQSHVAVFHKDDPRLSYDNRSRYGCWDLTEQDKQFRELQRVVEVLQRKANRKTD